jgi:integrase
MPPDCGRLPDKSSQQFQRRTIRGIPEFEQFVLQNLRTAEDQALSALPLPGTEPLLAYRQEKTGKTVSLTVHADLLSHLQRLSEAGTVGPLCRSISGKSPSGKHGLSEGFKRIVRRAGVDLMVVKGKGTRNFSRRTFHSLRHTFSSLLAGQGVPEDVRMHMTGHSSRDMHQRYTHHNIEALQKAIDSIPSKGLAS